MANIGFKLGRLGLDQSQKKWEGIGVFGALLRKNFRFFMLQFQFHSLFYTIHCILKDTKIRVTKLIQSFPITEKLTKYQLKINLTHLRNLKTLSGTLYGDKYNIVLT